MKILIIDDLKDRHQFLGIEYQGNDIHNAYTYNEAIELIKNNSYDLICFDHDLNDFEDRVERTGVSIAKFMAYAGLKTSEVRIHSLNAIGAMNIISVLKSGEVTDNVYYEPFDIRVGFRSNIKDK